MKRSIFFAGGGPIPPQIGDMPPKKSNFVMPLRSLSIKMLI